MNTSRLLLLTSFMSLGFVGCAQNNYGSGLSPGVIVANPTSQPTGSGTGYLDVVWSASQAGLNPTANLWWINAPSPQPINKTHFPMSAGPSTVTFGPLAGYTAPAAQPIRIWRGQTTTLTVTYGQP